jgi:hypothetical protein
VREHTVRDARGDAREHADLAQGLSARLEGLPSAVEQHTMRAYLDACETQG